ncbi:MAG: hypothetical protein ACHQRJ_02090 [Alphaproteobacteria bacterium]
MTSTALNPERRWVLALALLYLAFYAWLLVAGHGMPYVTDGNESFSIFWHAYNLFHFDIGQSLGITDEAYGPHAAAHPYLYTHQGNFPRLFGFLIYVFGARTIESQVVATTAIVGTATLVLAYRYFARIADPAFAAIYCALLMTDYVLYAEWHVVTDRVWSGFFVFALLSSTHALGGERPRRAQALLFLVGFGLFYGELAFALMLSAAAVVYALALYRRRLALALRAISGLAAGGALAMALLFLQLSAHFGTDVVIKDLRYTFAARNFASSPAGRETVRSFFEAHHIAFWPNYVNGDLYRNLEQFVFSLGRYDLQVYTPVFCLVTGILLAGWVLGTVGAGASLAPASRNVEPWRASPSGQRAIDAILLLHLAAALFLVLRPIAVGEGVFALYPAAAPHGAPPHGLQIRTGTMLAAVLALAGAAALVRRTTGSWWATTRMPPWAAVRLLVLLLASGAALGWQRDLYDGGGGGELAEIWMLPLAARSARALARLGVAAALALAIDLATGGARAYLARACAGGLARIGLFVVSGLVGYGAVYWLSPGIVLSGFQWRYAPFVVFFLCALPAAAFYLLLLGAVRMRAAWRAREAGETVLGLAAAGLLAAGAVYWAGLQLSYIRLLPPDHAGFFRKLAEPPFRGSGFVSNSYAAPLTVFTGEWGYSDTAIGKGGIVLTADGYVVHRDMHSNLWFADRESNPAYAVPEFYACFMQQNLAAAAARRVAQQHGWQPAGGCSTIPLIAEAGRPDAILRNEVVARDAPASDYWAVVRLDFDYPPYVRTLEATVERDAAGGRRAAYRADAEQQQGKPLVSPLAELVAMPGDGSCKLDPAHLVTLAKTEDGSPLSLAPDFTGTLAVRYVPRTATREGEPVLSQPWRVTAGDAAPCPWPTVTHGLAASQAPRSWTLEGWGDAEPWGIWTVGPVARLVPDIHTLPDRGLRLTVTGSAFVAPGHPSVEATVRANGVEVGRWRFALGATDGSRSVFIPRAVLERRMPPEISFEIADPISPLELGISTDERRLGLAVREVDLAEGNE